MKTLAAITTTEGVRQLAVTLWSAGRYDEASVTLEDALSEHSSLECEEIVSLSVTLAVVKRAQGKHDEALSVMRSIASLVQLCSLPLKGRYHNGLGASHFWLKNYDQTFQEWTAASYYHEQAGELKPHAEVENNIACLLIEMGKPDEAHSHLDRALAACGDVLFVAQVDDTRARALLASGDTKGALNVALASVARLKDTDATTFLETSIRTLALVCKAFEKEREAERIEDAIDRASGNRQRAADILGISRQALEKKLERKHKHLIDKCTPKRQPRGKYAKK
jgi:predicted negative regulator of RcsB-dependent stress response